MLGFLSKSVENPPLPRRASAPPKKRAYAIGDVHGRLDLLEDLLQQIERDIGERPTKSNHIIFLGDLIDRGPSSRGVIEKLMDYKPAHAKCHFIMGNHEEALVRGLRGEPDQLDGWLKHGGDATAESYGIDQAYLRRQGNEALEHALISAIPDRHVEFMAGFLDRIQFGDYLMVHAGIRPGIPIEDQHPSDLRWIRREFLDSQKDHGFVIVHGHTVEPEISNQLNRIGIDTGAYDTGVLTAVRLEGEDVCFLQARQYCEAD
ncbi:serine/threonine protein phosphatase [Henriciella barbarensis]|uniref:Serine/threonine protein phosphatase n=1 Tax=Henriciella barbarensis TaxID=86342 RepID=A0A399QSI3_9PROT|nr:metallophosphoesterase [Henriciella barbarensis]RIJ20477.1 serine/threonine protein phosphatase [Henriciella barbarensis]